MDRTIQDEFLIWASSAPEADRFEVLGKLLDCFKIPELKAAQNKVKNAWKRKYKIDNAPKSEVVPEPSVPESTKVRGWWTKYKKREIVAFDTEHVELYEPHPSTGLKKMAGEISIVNFDKKVIYQAKIFHAEGTFKDNVIAGYRSNSLIDGKPFEEVQEEVIKILKNKLLVTAGGEGDFSGMDLPVSSFDHFDIQWHFRKPNGQFTRHGDVVLQAIGLRSLYKHYFNEDIQDGAHSAETDALATMSLFVKYVTDLKKTDLDSRQKLDYPKEFEDILTLKHNFIELKRKFYRTKL